MDKQDLIDKLNKIVYAIDDLPQDSSLSTVVKDLKKIGDDLSNIVQKLEDEVEE